MPAPLVVPSTDNTLQDKNVRMRAAAPYTSARRCMPHPCTRCSLARAPMRRACRAQPLHASAACIPRAPTRGPVLRPRACGVLRLQESGRASSGGSPSVRSKRCRTCSSSTPWTMKTWRPRAIRPCCACARLARLALDLLASPALCSRCSPCSPRSRAARVPASLTSSALWCTRVADLVRALLVVACLAAS